LFVDKSQFSKCDWVGSDNVITWVSSFTSNISVIYKLYITTWLVMKQILEEKTLGHLLFNVRNMIDILKRINLFSVRRTDRHDEIYYFQFGELIAKFTIYSSG